MGHGFNLQTTTLAPTLPDLRRLRRLLPVPRHIAEFAVLRAAKSSRPGRPGPISWGDGIITGKSWTYDCLYIYRDNRGLYGTIYGQYKIIRNNIAESGEYGMVWDNIVQFGML